MPCERPVRGATTVSVAATRAAIALGHGAGLHPCPLAMLGRGPRGRVGENALRHGSCSTMVSQERIPLRAAQNRSGFEAGSGLLEKDVRREQDEAVQLVDIDSPRTVPGRLAGAAETAGGQAGNLPVGISPRRRRIGAMRKRAVPGRSGPIRTGASRPQAAPGCRPVRFKAGIEETGS
jgi:hypothetical protein